MQSIIECDNCGYSRSSEEDGRQFEEVCGVCYDDSCPTETKPVTICRECYLEDRGGLINPGESLFT